MKQFLRFNLFILIFTFFCLGGIFWLWKGIFSAPRTFDFQEIPPEFDQISETTPPKQNPPVVTPTSSVSVTLSQETLPVSTPPLASTSTVVSANPLSPFPARVLLDVPFTSQAPEKNWQQPWQDACEEAAVLMMDAYYQGYGLSVALARDEMRKMVEWGEGFGWGLSIEIAKIQKIFEDYLGYPKSSNHPNTAVKKPRIVENPTIEDIKRFVSQGNPVYVVADGKRLGNPHFQNGGPEYHALVVRGYTETSFITNDPGTQFGENYPYKYKDLMESIRDWNDGDVKNGRRVVLVIE